MTVLYGEKKIEPWWRDKDGIRDGIYFMPASIPAAPPSHLFGHLGFACGCLLSMAAGAALSVAVGGGPAGFALGAIMGCVIPAAGYLLGDRIDEYREFS